LPGRGRERGGGGVSDAYEARFTGPEHWLRIVRVTDGQPICTRGTEAWDDALHELNALAARISVLEGQRSEAKRLRSNLFAGIRLALASTRGGDCVAAEKALVYAEGHFADALCEQSPVWLAARVAELEAENTALKVENKLVRISVDAIGAGAVWQLANDPRTARIAELEAEIARRDMTWQQEFVANLHRPLPIRDDASPQDVADALKDENVSLVVEVKRLREALCDIDTLDLERTATGKPWMLSTAAFIARAALEVKSDG
jgi:regulator of replication initiation timing